MEKGKRINKSRKLDRRMERGNHAIPVVQMQCTNNAFTLPPPHSKQNAWRLESRPAHHHHHHHPWPCVKRAAAIPQDVNDRARIEVSSLLDNRKSFDDDPPLPSSTTPFTGRLERDEGNPGDLQNTESGISGQMICCWGSHETRRAALFTLGLERMVGRW